MTQQTRTLAGPVTIVFLSPAYLEGREAARKDFDRDPHAVPLEDLIRRYQGDEFAEGYLNEWTEQRAAAMFAGTLRAD